MTSADVETEKPSHQASRWNSCRRVSAVIGLSAAIAMGPLAVACGSNGTKAPTTTTITSTTTAATTTSAAAAGGSQHAHRNPDPDRYSNGNPDVNPDVDPDPNRYSDGGPDVDPDPNRYSNGNPDADSDGDPDRDRDREPAPQPAWQPVPAQPASLTRRRSS